MQKQLCTFLCRRKSVFRLNIPRSPLDCQESFLCMLPVPPRQLLSRWHLDLGVPTHPRYTICLWHQPAEVLDQTSKSFASCPVSCVRCLLASLQIHLVLPFQHQLHHPPVSVTTFLGDGSESFVPMYFPTCNLGLIQVQQNPCTCPVWLPHPSCLVPLPCTAVFSPSPCLTSLHLSLPLIFLTTKRT